MTDETTTTQDATEHEDPTTAPEGWTDRAEISYVREGKLTRFTMQTDSDELRCVLLAMWLRMPGEMAADFLGEMIHYAKDANSKLPGLTVALLNGGEPSTDDQVEDQQPEG